MVNSPSEAGLADTPAADMGILGRILKDRHLKISSMNAVKFDSLL